MWRNHLNIKGLQKLRSHVPDLQSPVGIAKIGIPFGAILGLTTVFFVYVRRGLPDWSLDGQVIIVTIGFLLMRMFFTNKKTFIFRYGDLAYRNAFIRFALPGLALIFAAVAHIGYMPGPIPPKFEWTFLIPIAGWYFLLIGPLLWIRSIITFGVDNLAMLYVYYPKDGHRVSSDIYSVLRHPVYAGVLRLAIGLALLNSNVFAIFFGVLLMPFGLTAWVRLVEEKELLERFGSGYNDYRKATPAFWPHPNSLGKFFHFLLKRE